MRRAGTSSWRHTLCRAGEACASFATAAHSSPYRSRTAVCAAELAASLTSSASTPPTSTSSDSPGCSRSTRSAMTNSSLLALNARGQSHSSNCCHIPRHSKRGLPTSPSALESFCRRSSWRAVLATLAAVRFRTGSVGASGFPDRSSMRYCRATSGHARKRTPKLVSQRSRAAPEAACALRSTTCWKMRMALPLSKRTCSGGRDLP
mmetsp:Transcript_14808/g.47169  ORF Transcript_14808/g.47169 Transcript_14808/m.47169 type:complete len:206 (-) Transcript_14808:414-1031(-)